MGAKIILLPTHPDFAYPRIEQSDRGTSLEEISPSSGDDKGLLSREELRAYMLVHSARGNLTMPRRTPFVGETKSFPSPIDPKTKFVIRRLSIQQVMLYRDRNSVVRYVTESAGESNERYITERDYPTGTMTLDVATFGLASWNIQDEEGNNLKINEDNIKKYLDPVELDFVADKVFDVNPILRGNQKSQTEGDTGTTDGSTDGGDDTPTVCELLSEDGGGEGELREHRVSSHVSADVDGSEKTSKSTDWSYPVPLS
jgi:hypothetical protein